jgi:hypothetical protein
MILSSFYAGFSFALNPPQLVEDPKRFHLSGVISPWVVTFLSREKEK